MDKREIETIERMTDELLKHRDNFNSDDVQKMEESLAKRAPTYVVTTISFIHVILLLYLLLNLHFSVSYLPRYPRLHIVDFSISPYNYSRYMSLVNFTIAISNPNNRQRKNESFKYHNVTTSSELYVNYFKPHKVTPLKQLNPGPKFDEIRPAHTTKVVTTLVVHNDAFDDRKWMENSNGKCLSLKYFWVNVTLKYELHEPSNHDSRSSVIVRSFTTMAKCDIVLNGAKKLWRLQKNQRCFYRLIEPKTLND